MRIIKLSLFLPLLFVLISFGTSNIYAGVLTCIQDPGGVDDIPGEDNQRDFNHFCQGASGDFDDICINQSGTVDCSGNATDDGNGDGIGQFVPDPDITPCAGDLLLTWNWDNTDWSGANSGDACALFDTDGDGNANFSYCVTVNGSPATFTAQNLFSCNDTQPDRCSGSSNVNGGNICGVDITDDDPFSGAGEDLSGLDTKGACCIDTATDIGAGATLIAVCAYPSDSPTSAPTECIFAPSGCTQDADCDDLDICTDDTCDIGTEACDSVFNPSNDPSCEPECSVDADCDDSDVCTADVCSNGQCFNTFNASLDDSCAAFVIIPTMGQWGMLLTAIVLGAFAIIRIRSLKDSELSL